MNSDLFTAANSIPDPFGEDPLLRPQINGLESSPEMSDLSRLAPPVGAPPARLCRTPEAFLGPTGASLVNLDALIPSNPPTKMHKNPFLSGTTNPLVNYKRHSFVIITFLFRFQHSVSHQPFPLRPSPPYPQPNEVILDITAASAHGVLQPVAAAPPVPSAAHPPLLSYTTSCQSAGPAIEPPAAPASPFPPIDSPLSGTDTQPQPLPLRWFCRRTQTPPIFTDAEPEEDPALTVLDIRVCKDTLAATSPELLKKSKH